MYPVKIGGGGTCPLRPQSEAGKIFGGHVPPPPHAPPWTAMYVYCYCFFIYIQAFKFFNTSTPV